MNDLKLVSKNGQLLVDSREVAEMVDKLHKNLIRDISRYCEVLAGSNLSPQEYFIESYYTDKQEKVRPHYFLTKLGCDMVANKMTGQKGILFTAAYTKKFREMEDQLNKQPVYSYMIDDPVERAQKWIEERKERDRLEHQLQIDKPYSSFGKAVSNSNAAINVGSFSKMMYDKYGINLGRNKMFAWLREKGYLIKHGREKNVPKQKYIEQGLFDTSVSLVTRTQGDIETVTTLITGKGQVKLAEQLMAEFGVTVE